VRILFTGASSFTGYWFVKELAAAGHEIVVTFSRRPDQYQGLRRSRLESVVEVARPVFCCRLGDPRFMKLIEEESSWELLCHHGAEASDYKSLDFDVGAALQRNTYNLRQVLAALRAKGCARLVLTGSVFEDGEGAGSDGLPAVSPYGLSKALTARACAYYAQARGLRLGKFVIANPFGPYEDARFVSYLMRAWLEGSTPSVNTPAYVRDNIHVSLLAKAYVEFATTLPAAPGVQKTNPSGYVESQGSFAQRVGQNVRERLNLTCGLELKHQSEFNEPRIRINTDPVGGDRLDWNESDAWDELVEYYEHAAGGEARR
jgi:nucleoside-diphosphate-sugar epimerase